MIFQLMRQEWLKTFRSKGFYKNLTVNIVLGFFALYFAALFLMLGFSLKSMLEKTGGGSPLELFNGAMLYILLAGLMMRFFMQQLNTLNLQFYQSLPVKRSSLINFLLLKPLFSPFNYILLLMVIPFAVKSVAVDYGSWTAVRFVMVFEFTVWFNSLFAAFLKRRFGSNVLSFFIILALFGGIFALEYFHIFSSFAVSQKVYGFLTMNAVGPLIMLIMVALAYWLNRWFFAANYYPESFNSNVQKKQTATANLSFLNRFGVIGELIGIQLKMMIRHKRTRSMLITGGLFMFYGLLFYFQKGIGDGLYVFAAMFMTGALMYLYGQWAVSWDSVAFDAYMTKNIPVRTYILSKYYLMLAFNVVCFLLTIPYFLMGSKIIYTHISVFLFNVGINLILLLFFSTFNNTKVDLSRSSAMNYQGTTYKSFLIVFPIMFFPMIFVSIVKLFGSYNLALILLGTMGLIGIIFSKQLVNMCVNEFNARKYKMAEGYRESE